MSTWDSWPPVPRLAPASSRSSTGTECIGSSSGAASWLHPRQTRGGPTSAREGCKDRITALSDHTEARSGHVARGAVTGTSLIESTGSMALGGAVKNALPGPMDLGEHFLFTG